MEEITCCRASEKFLTGNFVAEEMTQLTFSARSIGWDFARANSLFVRKLKTSAQLR